MKTWETIIGKKIDHVFVKERNPQNTTRAYMNCICDCGKHFVQYYLELYKRSIGTSKTKCKATCGCNMYVTRKIPDFNRRIKVMEKEIQKLKEDLEKYKEVKQ